MWVAGPCFVWVAVSEALFWVSVGYFGWVGVSEGGWENILGRWGWVGIGALFDNALFKLLFFSFTLLTNSKSYRILLQTKMFLDLTICKILKRDRNDEAENTAHLKIASSVLLEINCTPIIIWNVRNF